MRLLLYVFHVHALAILGECQNVTLVSRPVWSGTSVQDLWNEYYTIFPSRIRNAAAFRWSSFILERSWQMSADTFEHVASGYCAVAAAIVNPQERTRYRLQLPMIGGSVKSGLMYYCCWPCICDTLDFLRVDTKTVQLAGGISRQYYFAVMGDPCKNPIALTTPYTCPFSGQITTISQQAPEVKCGADGSLDGAAKSDNGYIIMSMFFEDGGQKSMEESYFSGFEASPCEKRAAGGFKSGMGLIFRKVASASPIGSFVAQRQAFSRQLRPISQTTHGSAAVDKPQHILTCPNGESGVPRTYTKQLRNISHVLLIQSSRASNVFPNIVRHRA